MRIVYTCHSVGSPTVKDITQPNLSRVIAHNYDKRSVNPHHTVIRIVGNSFRILTLGFSYVRIYATVVYA